MPLAVSQLYRFDEFVIDLGRRTFARNGESISISPKAFDVLTYLVTNPGRVVTKDELLKAIWPDSFVEEGNLAQHISGLRKALGERASDIVTVPGRGYQFAAQVRTESPVDLLPEMQALDNRAPDPMPAKAEDALVRGAREGAPELNEESLPAPVDGKAMPASRRVWPYYALAAVAVLAAAVWAGWRWLRPAAPAEFYKIVVADFTNTTGDATFDNTLKRALEISLEQSPFLDVMSERETVGTLQMMGQKGDTPLGVNVATELCVRSNRQVVLSGGIASVGSSYLLTLEATDCNSGKQLIAAMEQIAAKEKVLGALDVAADRIRRGLGESAKSRGSFQVPILQATTTSLEALKAYSLGQDLIAQGKGGSEALPFFQKAVALDPQFAMAYGALAIDYYNLDEYKLAAQYFQRAFDLSGSVSEREKFILRAHYYDLSQKDLAQAINAYQQWAATYPREWVPWVNIANDWTQLGRYAEAIPAGVRALELEPSRGGNIIYNVLTRAYKRANRFAEAKATAQRAVQRGKDSASLHALLFEVAFAEHDQKALSREIKWGQDHGDDWYFVYDWAFAEASLGKYGEAEDLFRKSYEIAERDNLPEVADGVLLDRASMEFHFGFPDVSRATLGRLHKPDPDSPDFAFLSAMMGDAPAQSFLDAHMSGTHDTLMAYHYVPLVRAALALQHGAPQDAIAALESAAPYEMADFRVQFVRGQAYLQANQPKKAASEYQKILDNPGIDPVNWMYPLAQLGLARARALQNRNSESRGEYDKFFALWKDADPELPVLKKAQLEYAHLQ
ncbi:MAG: winged helix-turn-helix domain-containing protein [Terriglobales bacterium]|jgi:DNA-binding winged helix-turn-helix (wHTH) protein/tetratricopeptide (TPR) repeat protein